MSREMTILKSGFSPIEKAEDGRKVAEVRKELFYAK
jgi:hypothetical protein